MLFYSRVDPTQKVSFCSLRSYLPTTVAKKNHCVLKLGEMTYGIVMLGKLGKMSFGILKLGETSFGMLVLGRVT